MPILPGRSPRQRAISDARPPDYLNPANYYVPMQYAYNSPRFVPLPMTPNPGYAPAGAFPYPAPMPWGGSPHFYPVDMSPQAVAMVDPRSTQMHVLLAPANATYPMPAFGQNQHLLYDVRYKPEKLYGTTGAHTFRITDDQLMSAATSPPVPRMRLMCRELPWRITVSNSRGVTVKDILDTLYNELCQPMTEGEWWIAQDEERERTLQAYKRNCSEEMKEFKRKMEDGVKRVDWLGKKTVVESIFRGPFDEEFIKSRVTDPKIQEEVWILRMADNDDE